MSVAREQPPTPTRGRRPLPVGELVLLVVLILLLVLGTIPPLINLGRFQRRVAGAISHAIGRPVSVASISLQLLPWPGFRLEDLTVGEDPGFGQEPALRAPEVVLEPSLTSLWRGRFEISKVELRDASVNLVRNSDGRWNISSVLLQASHIENAPTGARPHGSAPRFPYIEATDTRMNFKRGAEKLPFSILDADFSMWLASPGAWQLRVEGSPARTDLAMASGDMGTVRLSGEVRRATDFGVMPVALTGEWLAAPLGQAGRLLLGRDTGWRGVADLDAQFRGAMDSLAIHAHLTVANLHRQEFTPIEPFSLDVTCRGHYSRAASATDSFLCRAPFGDGALLLASDAVAAGTSRTVSVTAKQLPLPVAAAAAGLLRPGMPSADAFTGVLDGTLSWDAATRGVSGAMSAPVVGINNAGPDGQPLQLNHVTLTGSPAPGGLRVGCDPVPMGVAASPLRLEAQLDTQRYVLDAQGGATLEALDTAAAALRLRVLPHLAAVQLARGTVQLALTTAGPWIPAEGGATAPVTGTSGTVRLTNVAWQPGWLANAIAIPMATVALAPGTARWNIPLATLDTGTGAPLRLTATVQQAVGCGAGPGCESTFIVSLPELSTEDVESALASGRGGLFAALVQTFDPRQVHLPPVHGVVRAGVFTLGRMAVRNTTATLGTVETAQDEPTIRVESLDGQALGGTLHLAGAITAGQNAPVYTVDAALTGASAQQAAALWQQTWGEGTLGGSAHMTLTGSDAGELANSVRGSFQVSWQNGRLGAVLPHFASWDGTGTLSASGLTILKGPLSGTAGTLTGTIGWDRTLHLMLTPTPGAPGRPVTGTLAAPVAAAP